MLRLFGLRHLLQLARESVLSASVINPVGEVISRNAAAATYLASDTPVVQPFHPGSDQFELLQKPFNALGFKPLFLEHFAPFRFVYLTPQ